MSDQISAQVKLLSSDSNSAAYNVRRNTRTDLGSLLNTEAYTVRIQTVQPLTNQAISAASTAMKETAESPDFDRIPQAQRSEYLAKIGSSVASNEYYSGQVHLMSDVQTKDGKIMQYAPKYDYSQELEANKLGTSTVSGLSDKSPQMAQLESMSSIDNVSGYTQSQANRKLEGSIVDPYKNINNPNGAGPDNDVGQFTTIGGADLTVFLVMEVVPASELKYDPELQKKEIVMVEMDSALSISYSTMRERFPVRVLGQANPKAMTAGIRTIAGHIAFAVFTEDVLSRLRSRIKDEIDSVNSQFDSYDQKNSNDYKKRKEVWDREEQNYNRFAVDSLGNTIQLLDSLPPFHILVMGTTESGKFTQFMIKDVSIIDENQYQGTQQPNIINKVSFTALDLVPMHKVADSSGRVATVSASSVDESFAKGKYNGSLNFNQEVTGTGLLDSVMNDLGA